MAFYSFVIILFGLVGLLRFVLLLFMIFLENVLILKGILRQAALYHLHLGPVCVVISGFSAPVSLAVLVGNGNNSVWWFGCLWNIF